MAAMCKEKERQMTATFITGNALHLPMADNSVHCVVTSPPYWGLRDYGVDGQLGLEPTPEEYVADMVAVFREVKRVLRDDGTAWLNLGDSFAGSGRGLNGDGTPGKAGAKNRTNRGTQAGVYPGVDAGLKPKDLVGIPWRVAFALQADGWWLRSDIIWHKPNPMPESVTDRCTKAHEYIFLLSKSSRYYFDNVAIQEPANPENYRSNPSTQCVPPGQTKHGKLYSMRGEVSCETRNKRSVWTIPTKPFSGAHFAVFPPALIEPCILAGSRPGDIVFDPFLGSGTTAQVAQHLGRQWIGCELNPQYLDLQNDRTRQQGLIL